MNIIIEKDIPLPLGAGNRGATKYPFAEMEIEDSIYISNENNSIHAARTSAYHYGYRHNKKFTASEQNGGVRIWRIK